MLCKVAEDIGRDKYYTLDEAIKGLSIAQAHVFCYIKNFAKNNIFANFHSFNGNSQQTLSLISES